MSIHFDKKRWEEIKGNYQAWWEGTLKRPMIKGVVCHAYSPQRKAPKTPLLSMKNCNDFSYSPEELIDALDYELEQMEFLGDAFPFVNLQAFGPGTLAGFCGAEMNNRTGNVWFFPKVKQQILDINIKYNPENVWVKRIKDIYRAGQDRWAGQVLMSMPDLGGILDIIATFVGSDDFLLDLLEEPEEVKRLQKEVYTAFMEAYEDFNSVLQPVNPGYSDWGGLYSQTPSYILQNDFAFMIGPDMFKEFAMPEIIAATNKLDHTIYHLDGVGNLNHLDLLLEVKNLDAIQWVYGAGQPSAKHWLEVYEKIHASNKKMEVIGGMDDFDVLAEKYYSELFYHILIDDNNSTMQKSCDYKDCLNDYGIVPFDDKKNALRFLKKYHCL